MVTLLPNASRSRIFQNDSARYARPAGAAADAALDFELWRMHFAMPAAFDDAEMTARRSALAI